MRLVVGGSLEWPNDKMVEECIGTALELYAKKVATTKKPMYPVTLVYGDMKGTDSSYDSLPSVDEIVVRLANKWGWELEPHPWDTKRTGTAGLDIRNREMLAQDADLCIVFIYPDYRASAPNLMRTNAISLRNRAIENHVPTYVFTLERYNFTEPDNPQLKVPKTWKGVPR